MVIGFLCEKGGVGKSTLCFNTAVELSRAARVLIIDADLQHENLTALCGCQKHNIKTLYEVLEKNVPLQQCVIPIGSLTLDIVPADDRLIKIQNGFSEKSEEQKKQVRRLRSEIAAVSKNYDYVLIDGSPSPSWLQYLCMISCDGLVVPLSADVTAIGTVKAIYRSVSDIGNLKIYGFVFNKFDSRSNLQKAAVDAVEQMAKKIGTKVFKTHIRSASAMAESWNLHIGICDYKTRTAKNISEDIRNFVNELRETVNNDNRIYKCN